MLKNLLYVFPIRTLKYNIMINAFILNTKLKIYIYDNSIVGVDFLKR